MMQRSITWMVSRTLYTSFRRKLTVCQSEESKPFKKSEGTHLSRRLKQAVLEGKDSSKSLVSKNSKTTKINEHWEEEFPEEMPDSKMKRSSPVEVRCFDTARVSVKSGAGGNGCVAFHREKYVTKGGPSGGNGGRGGHVWAVADNNFNSLLGFRNKMHYRAGKGGHGKGADLTGAQGEDALVLVPPGTIIRYKDADESQPPLAELIKNGDRALLAEGGKGGRGNAAFKTSRNTAPTIAENGAPGEEDWLDLELKVVADVGIIGVPNAGKSTFLASISAAKPKIANYPFTTLIPNLGVCGFDFETTVFADVPGLLEGASQGIGLGHEFLRHCMRCRALMHIIDGTSPDPLGDYEAIQLELQLFSPELASKPQIICYNKTDIEDAVILWEDVKQQLMSQGVEEDRIFAISAVAGRNTESAVRAIRRILKQLPAEEETQTTALNIQKPKSESQKAKIEDFEISIRKDLSPALYTVHGEALELFTSMTNWTYYEALRRFQRVLDRSGVNVALLSAGIQEGDDVAIGDHVFSWSNNDSEQELYETFKINKKAEGRASKGVARWPHVG